MAVRTVRSTTTIPTTPSTAAELGCYSSCPPPSVRGLSSIRYTLFFARLVSYKLRTATLNSIHTMLCLIYYLDLIIPMGHHRSPAHGACLNGHLTRDHQLHSLGGLVSIVSRHAMIPLPPLQARGLLSYPFLIPFFSMHQSLPLFFPELQVCPGDEHHVVALG